MTYLSKKPTNDIVTVCAIKVSVYFFVPFYSTYNINDIFIGAINFFLIFYTVITIIIIIFVYYCYYYYFFYFIRLYFI